MRDLFCDFAEVDALLERLLDLPEEPADLRRRLLDEATRGRPELRETAEKLLRTLEAADSPLERGAALPERRAALLAEAAAEEPASGLVAGTRLGRYEVVSQIGSGGMGEVYRARDTRLGRDVALKVLPEDVAADPERLRRFEREAKALAALNHPNIATLHGLDEEGGLLFLVLELIAGETLRDRVERGALPLAEALDVATQVATALEAAHEAGIVHRDLKPANVKVTPGGRVKLLDFGIAKVLPPVVDAGEISRVETFVSGTALGGAVLGTAPYMSPEQWRARVVDHRSDIWSFGCVLYEILSGRRAFDGETHTDIAVAVLGGQPDWLALPEGTSESVLELLRRCLDKEPEGRPATIAEVRSVLETERVRRSQASSGKARHGERSHRREASLRSAGRRSALVVAAVIVVVAAVPAGFLLRRALDDRSAAAAGAALEREQRRPMIAVLPFENLGDPEDLYFTDGITEEIRSRLGVVEDLGIVSRTSASRYRGSPLAAREIGAELGVEYLLEGTVRWQRAGGGENEVRVTPRLVRVQEDAQVWTEQYDAELADVFRVQSDIARQVAERLGVAIRRNEARVLGARPTANLEAYQAYLRGDDYLQRGRELQSRNEVEIAIDMLRQATRLDPEFALAWSRLAHAHAWLYLWHFDRSEPRLAAARNAVARALELDRDLGDAHFARGMILIDEDEPERAIEEYRRVLRFEPNHAYAHYGLSQVAISLGDWEQGRRHALRALELSPGTADIACWTGGAHSFVSDYAKSIEYHDHAVQLAPDRACHYFCEAEAYLNWDGDPVRARRLLERVPEHLDREKSPALDYHWVQVEVIEGRLDEALQRLAGGSSPVLESPWFVMPKSLLAAQIHAMREQPELARGAYSEAVGTLEPMVGSRPLDARLHGALGIAYAGLGRREEAVREANRGVELLGGNKTDACYRLRDLVLTHAVLGDHGQALAALERLLALRGGYFSPAYLRIDPGLRELRGDPRFAALLSEAGRLSGAPQPQRTRSASAGLAEDPSLGRTRTEQAKRPASSSGIAAR